MQSESLAKHDPLYRSRLAALWPDTERFSLPVASHGMGGPHVERDGSGFHYVVNERGTESERRTTSDENEVLAWLLVDTAAAIASQYSMTHSPVDGKSPDLRALRLQRELDLLSNPELDSIPFVRERVECLKKLLK